MCVRSFLNTCAWIVRRIGSGVDTGGRERRGWLGSSGLLRVTARVRCRAGALSCREEWIEAGLEQSRDLLMERAAGCCRQHGLWRTCLAPIIMADKSTAGMLLPSTHPVLGSRARLVRSRGSGTRYPSTRRTYSSSNSHRSPRCYRAQPEYAEYPGRVPRVPRPSTQITPPEVLQSAARARASHALHAARYVVRQLDLGNPLRCTLRAARCALLLLWGV